MATIVTEFGNQESKSPSLLHSHTRFCSEYLPSLNMKSPLLGLTWHGGWRTLYGCSFSSLLAVGVVQTTDDAVWTKNQLCLQTKVYVYSTKPPREACTIQSSESFTAVRPAVQSLQTTKSIRGHIPNVPFALCLQPVFSTGHI